MSKSMGAIGNNTSFKGLVSGGTVDVKFTPILNASYLIIFALAYCDATSINDDGAHFAIELKDASGNNVNITHRRSASMCIPRAWDAVTSVTFFPITLNANIEYTARFTNNSGRTITDIYDSTVGVIIIPIIWNR